MAACPDAANRNGARNTLKVIRPVLCGLTMALFVLLAAAAGAGFVSAYFVRIDGLLVIVLGLFATHELKLRQLLILLPLDVPREILNGG